MKANVNGIEVYYELHGRDGAPWLVLSHSLACSTRMWDPQIDAFKERLVLADTTSRYPAEAAGVWAERIKTAETRGMQPLVQPTLERWFTEPFRKAHPEVVERVGALIASTPVAGYVGCSHAIPKINLTARLKEIKLPILVICGEQDGGTPPAMAREIHDNAPGSRLVLIPRAAHLSNLEQPQAFNRALEEFLSSPSSA
jgi:3-oxoadipate enol-lactonase